MSIRKNVPRSVELIRHLLARSLARVLFVSEWRHHRQTSSSSSSNTHYSHVQTCIYFSVSCGAPCARSRNSVASCVCECLFSDAASMHSTRLLHTRDIYYLLERSAARTTPLYLMLYYYRYAAYKCVHTTFAAAALC